MNRITRLRALALAIALLPMTSQAEPSPCALTLPPPELQKCLEAQADAMDARLDGLMRELKKSLNSRNWDYVKTSQILWEKARGYDCKVEGSFEERALQTSVKYQCMAWYGRERMHQLRYLLCPRYWRTGQCDAAKAYE